MSRIQVRPKVMAVAAVGLVAGAAVVAGAPAATAAVQARTTKPLMVRFFGPATTVLPGPKKATFRAPAVTVTGGAPGVAAAVKSAVDRHLAGLRTAFAAEIAEMPSVPGVSLGDVVSASSSRSVHYLGVSLAESANTGGAHPSNTLHAYTFDLATGREVTVASLLRSPTATDTVIRAAFVAQNRNRNLTAAQVAGVSVIPGRNGSTAPLSCYPTGPGLHCSIDQGTVAAYALGAFDATVPWSKVPVKPYR